MMEDQLVVMLAALVKASVPVGTIAIIFNCCQVGSEPYSSHDGGTREHAKVHAQTARSNNHFTILRFVHNFNFGQPCARFLVPQHHEASILHIQLSLTNFVVMNYHHSRF